MREHGTYSCYSMGCRLPECRQAKADYMRTRRLAARVLAAKYTRSSTGNRPSRHTAWAPGATRYVATGVTHGTGFAYDERGCRCEPCTTFATFVWKRGNRERTRTLP